MEFLLGGTRGPIRVKYPALNAWVNDEGLMVTAEVPGVNPEDIEITILDDTLTLSGSRNTDELPDGAEFKRRERGSGEFSRSIELPFRVDGDAVEAHFNNGVLQITLPRVPEEKPRKITVKSA
jgi:HSP20 family protein